MAGFKSRFISRSSPPSLFRSGRYMARVFQGERTFMSPVLRPLEIGLYRIAGVDETREQHWITYTVAMLLFNAAGFLCVYALMRLQGLAAAQPSRHVGRRPRPDLQYGGQLRHQHQLAELWRREHAQLSDADGGSHHPEFRLGRHRYRARRRAHPRLCARLGEDRRQFLGRSHSLHPLRAAAALDHCRTDS